MAHLTDRKARTIKPDGKAFAHGGIPGLTLEPSPTVGQGKWVLRYTSPVTAKRRKAGLGSFPLVGIADAAKAAMEMRIKIRDGIDPLEESSPGAVNPKRRAKSSTLPIVADPSFEQAAHTLHASLKPSWKNPKHANQWINTLIQYAFPAIGKLRLSQIKSAHIEQVLSPIWLEKQETALRLKQRMQAVMDWGCAHGYCTSNPVEVVNRILPSQKEKAVRSQHHPAMPWASIPAFIQLHYSSGEAMDCTRAIVLFVILTACRSGEARGMTWDEIDWKNHTWVIPASRMKMGIAHRVPLSKQAVQILKQQQGLHPELVFPSLRKMVQLSDMALTKFMRDHQAQSDTTGRIATMHGFRSSFRDWCSENGKPRDLAERALAHAVANQVEAAYHRTDLLEQRRPLMQEWADFVAPFVRKNSLPAPSSLTEAFRTLPPVIPTPFTRAAKSGNEMFEKSLRQK